MGNQCALEVGRVRYMSVYSVKSPECCIGTIARSKLCLEALLAWVQKVHVQDMILVLGSPTITASPKANATTNPANPREIWSLTRIVAG